MEDNLNLDIESYNTDELLQLFNINNFENKDNITAQYNYKLQSLEEIQDRDLKSTLKSFFNAAYEKILQSVVLKNKNPINKIIRKNPDIFGAVNVSVNTQLMHPEPVVLEPPITSTYPIQYPLGVINPVEKKITSEIFSLDTIFRDLKKYPESSNFVYELPNHIENVISMKLLSAEIQNTEPLFSKELKNNELVIKMYNGKEIIYDASGYETGLVDFPPEGLSLTVAVPCGAPSLKILLDGIQTVLDSQRNSFSFLNVSIETCCGKIYFRYKTLLECLVWNKKYYQDPSNNGRVYPPDNILPTSIFKMPSCLVCDSSGTMINSQQYNYLKRIYLGSVEGNLRGISDSTDALINSLVGGKMLSYEINLNPSKQKYTKSLGWLLGFRSRNWNLHEQCPPPKYDTNENTELITYDNTFIRNNILFNGWVNANTPYGDNTVEYMYIYVNDFVGNYNDTLNAALSDETFLARSLLARIQIKEGFYSIQFEKSQGLSILEKERNYFGPVNIKKLHIKLLNKYGKVLKLGNTNYSLTFQFDKLYSSIRN
jgi:hypothetical protein|tara:strand:+ start:80 stop:1705 length:1626 start_codon:yes stop_codon:yes gene_type:complete